MLWSAIHKRTFHIADIKLFAPTTWSYQSASTQSLGTELLECGPSLTCHTTPDF